MTFFETFFKITLAIILTSVIGVERGFRHKGAGLRTHLLVGVGSTLIVLTSIHLFDIYKDVTTIDPTRMIAAIITGIGFLCAGTIIRGGSNITGLTTAATLWIVSCIGIAVGSGHYSAAIMVSIFVFIILIKARVIQQTLEKKFKKHL